MSVLALLTVLALGSLNVARRQAQLAHTSFELAQQRELADSALRVTILQLAASEQGASATALAPRSVMLFGMNVAVSVEHESGRVDLNYASESLLVATLAGNGVSEPEARSLAARIVDWRDHDDMRMSEGAESSEYRRAHRVGPRNGFFESVSELRLVLGAEVLSERLLDAFTVYSHRPEVPERIAIPAVKNALEWAQSRNLEQRRWLGEVGNLESIAQRRGIEDDVLRLYACTAPVPLQTCRTVIVRLTGDPAYPALVFAWE